MFANNPSRLVFVLCTLAAIAGATVGVFAIVASSLGALSHGETLALILCAIFPMIVGIVGMLIHGDAA